MAREVLRRKAADNVYLHKDFHGALSAGLTYLEARYGEQAVREYLRHFASAYYAPLREDLRRRGLPALREYFEGLYRLEGGEVRARMDEDERGLVIEVAACPAVAHMRAHGYPVARLWRETTRTVNEAICEGTPFAAELSEYDEPTGRSVMRFRRRDA